MVKKYTSISKYLKTIFKYLPIFAFFFFFYHFFQNFSTIDSKTHLNYIGPTFKKINYIWPKQTHGSSLLYSPEFCTGTRVVSFSLPIHRPLHFSNNDFRATEASICLQGSLLIEDFGFVH